MKEWNVFISVLISKQTFRTLMNSNISLKHSTKFLLNIVFRALCSMYIICYLQFLFWLWHASETPLRKAIHFSHSQGVHDKHYACIYLHVNKVLKMKDVCVFLSLQYSFKLVPLVSSTSMQILLLKNKAVK